jgi:hypothetical protein
MLNVLYILIDMQSNLSRHRNVVITSPADTVFEEDFSEQEALPEEDAFLGNGPLPRTYSEEEVAEGTKYSGIAASMFLAVTIPGLSFLAIFVGTHYIRRAWAVSENPARIARIVRVVNIAWSIIQVLALITIIIGGNLWIQDMQHQQQQMPYSSVSPQPTARY